MYQRTQRWSWALTASLALLLVSFAFCGTSSANKPTPSDPQNDYAVTVRPLLQQYCLTCHSAKIKKGSLDLERFASIDQVRKDLKPWQGVIEMLEAGEMPPKKKLQPTAEERQRLIAWVRGFLDAEALARAGDPGHVPVRRLSNAEYDYTVRDLTGVDLRPTREFPADGAAGEGFTNAAEALSDISPTLLAKYLNAAKDISEHAVLLPDGFRFSPTKTRRDWTNESTAKLRKFYARFTPDGQLPLQPYLAATVRYRDALTAGKVTLAEVAIKEKLSPKYLGVLWQTLTDSTPSQPLDLIRARWRQTAEKNVAALSAEINTWEAALWKFVPIGSYRYGNTVRQVANDPPVDDAQSLKLVVKPAPRQTEVVLYFAARDLSPNGKGGLVVWQHPRFERAGKPAFLLRDYADFGPRYEVEYPAVFADTERYLAAAAKAANDRKLSAEDIARQHGLDPAFLKQWISVTAIEPFPRDKADLKEMGRIIPTVALDLLTEKAPQTDQKPAINGWRPQNAGLPTLMTNSSDRTEQVPGRVSPHKVAVHPTPEDFVAVAWKSPLAGEVRLAAHIAHAHPVCGNGIAWWIEHRHEYRATVLAEGTCDLGKEAAVAPRTLKVAKGDLVLLAIDARDGNHGCDLTEIALTITQTAQPGSSWDLAADVADSVLDGNPHADKLGNKNVWSFVKGPAKLPGFFKGSTNPTVPPASLLGKWRTMAADPARTAEAARLADQIKALLVGARPVQEKNPDRILYDNLVAPESPLFVGVDLAHLTKAQLGTKHYGLDKKRFGRHPLGKPMDGASLVSRANEVIEFKVPATLFKEREFVVEGRLDSASGGLVQIQVLTAPSSTDDRWDGKGPLATVAAGPGYKQMIQGRDEFRRCFPQFICFPQIIPTDEVVCLKMYHREDEPLSRLFLDEGQKRQLDRLWAEHRFISQQPVAENKYLPLFIGFVTQDQPKELLAYFEGQRGTFRKRAEDFEKDVAAAGPRQLEALLAFATRAYRRPLQEKEHSDLLGLYQKLRNKGVPHDEAVRALLARVLVAPGFLFRIEQPPPGKQPGLVNDWELATRLSYFLWSSVPDDELRRVAAAGQLRDPKVLAAQAQRLLKDERVRALAVEFGTQWIHVRGFDELKEKNEKLFPTFDSSLRQAIYEESILFFQDLFQNDRAVTKILNADYTFLNEKLARHYGIPGVLGPQWRKVEGVGKFGRGGILGLASVQARQAGASRTSPVLRGNWVVETLLGEKLPRPPANVPRLPEEEGGADRLTMRQLVEKHARVAECAVCHQRMDPFGFTLERYDSIGRLRDRDLGGLPVDTRARLKDGTELEGIDGLRTYLLTKKKDVVVRLFCRRLLGYALGRSVTLADQLLVDEMVGELNKSDARISAAVLVIVRSPQFRSIRGSDVAADE